MALRYTKLQSTVKVEALGTVTLTAGPDTLKTIDLTASPFAHGFHYVLLALQNMSLAGSTTLTAAINSAADGSGTSVTIATMTLGASDSNVALEIPSELVSHYSDRNDIDAKSLVFKIDGALNDTVDGAIVSSLTTRQEGLTPSDVTTVS